jgi:putative transposase
VSGFLDHNLAAVLGIFVPGRLLLRLPAPIETYGFNGGSSDPEAQATFVHEQFHFFQTLFTGYGQVAWLRHRQLTAFVIHVGRKRVARLMKCANLEGVSRRRKYRSTRDKDARPAPDLVEREFVATAPNQLWVADITYVPTWSGFLYLAVVLDVFSHRIVGWAMASHLRAELVIDALNMAVGQRRPSTVIHHSDQGCQYTSVAFGLRCREVGVKPSMGSVGDAYDNAMCESFFATLECELLDRRRFKNHAEAEMAIFDFIEGFYNTHRIHPALDYRSPVEYEEQQAVLVA